MTKKHFEALAAAVRAEVEGWDTEQEKGRHAVEALAFMASALADVCAQFNPNFDRARFLAACGVAG